MSLSSLPALVDANPPSPDSFLSVLLQIALALDDELYLVRHFIHNMVPPADHQSPQLPASSPKHSKEANMTLEGCEMVKLPWHKHLL